MKKILIVLLLLLMFSFNLYAQNTITVGHSQIVKEPTKAWMNIIAINPNDSLQIAQIHYDLQYYPLFLANPKFEDLTGFIKENYEVRVVDRGMVTQELRGFYIEITAKNKSIPIFPPNIFLILGKLKFDRLGTGISFGVNNEPKSFVTIFTSSNMR